VNQILTVNPFIGGTIAALVLGGLGAFLATAIVAHSAGMGNPVAGLIGFSLSAGGELLGALIGIGLHVLQIQR